MRMFYLEIAELITQEIVRAARVFNFAYAEALASLGNAAKLALTTRNNSLADIVGNAILDGVLYDHVLVINSYRVCAIANPNRAYPSEALANARIPYVSMANVITLINAMTYSPHSQACKGL